MEPHRHGLKSKSDKIKTAKESKVKILFLGVDYCSEDVMSIDLTIRDADVRFAQLLHSIATKVIISKKTVKLLPTVDSHKIVYALERIMQK